MHDVHVVVEHRRLAEQNVGGVGVIGLLDGSHTIEPHHLDSTGAIGKQSLKTPFAALTHRTEREKPSLELHHRFIAMQLVDMVDDTAVDVTEGEIVQQVIIGTDVQFLPEQLGSLGTHTMQVLYVGVAQVRHRGSTDIRQVPGPLDGLSSDFEGHPRQAPRCVPCAPRPKRRR